MIQEGVDQSPTVMARRRVDHHAGGFVYRDDMIIFVKDAQRQFFRNEIKRLRIRKGSFNMVPLGSFPCVRPLAGAGYLSR